MIDRECVEFLQWSLPRLRMRWQGFRKVRGQVCKRISERMRELALPDAAAYRSRLEQHPDEWQVLDSFCRVTISRFFRDHAVFQFLEREVLPRLARDAAWRGDPALRCWCIGCASGEEPYTIALLKHSFPGVELEIIATDADRELLRRAKEGCYPASSLKELLRDRVEGAFARAGSRYCLRESLKRRVAFMEQDIRKEAPDGMFGLVLCRNVAFTYFDEDLQREVLERIADRMVSGGALVIGMHETLPPAAKGFIPWREKSGIFLFAGKDQDA